MLATVDYKQIQKILHDHCPEQPVTEAEAAEAFHNLVGFLNILDQINARIGLVPDKDKNS